MPQVSYSEIKLMRRCPKAHHYRYIRNLRRRYPSRPALVGTILHEMLDVLSKAKRIHTYMNDPWKVLAQYKKQYRELFREQQEEYGDVPAITERIWEGYHRRWAGDKLKVLDSEVHVFTDLTPEIRLFSKIDMIVVDRGGRRFLVDHKFNRVIPDARDRFSDIQTLLYFWAYNNSHKKEDWLDGIIWDYGRMKAPTVPQLLKNGELSQRMNIDTDQHTYRQAIEEHGLNPKKYFKILDHLEGKERTFFERVSLPAPPKKLVELVVKDARESAVIGKHLAKQGITPRNMSGFNCSGCEYRTICEAEVRGLDAKFVLKKDYEVREHHGEPKYGPEEAA